MMKIWLSQIWGIFTGQWPRLRDYWATSGVLISIIAAFSAAGSSPNGSGVLAWIADKSLYSYLGIIGLSLALTLYCIFDGKDTLAYASIKDVPGVNIKIVVGNLLRFGSRGHALVAVGMNSDWECKLTSEEGRIAPGSLQGQITLEWFGGSGNLRAALERKAEGAPGRGFPSGAVPLGQTIRLDERGRRVMWVTMTRWNPDIGAYSTTVPELEQAMGGLWDGLRASHNLDEDIFCPVIGAAFGKIGDESPLDLLKRHIRSFVTASKEQKITETMIFVVAPKDLRNLNLVDLRDFLAAECRRESLRVHHVAEAGSAKEVNAAPFVSLDQEIIDASRELAVEMLGLRELKPTDPTHVEHEAKVVRKVEYFVSTTMRRLFSDERPLSGTLYNQNVRSATECVKWQKARTAYSKQS